MQRSVHNDNQNRFERDSLTWQVYLFVGFFSFLMNVLGPLTPFLRAELNITYTQAGLHFSAFATGMILMGLLGDRFVRLMGSRQVLWTGALGMGVGTLVLMIGHRLPVTVGAAWLMGTLGSLMVSVVPALLAGRHGDNLSIALTEANVTGALAGMAAPAAVGALGRTALGWRSSLLLPVAFLALMLLVFRRDVRLAPERQAAAGEGGSAAAPEQNSGRLPRVFWAFWALVLMVVAIECCMSYWGADYLEQAAGLKRADAALSMTLFLGAMALGRILGSGLVRLRPARELIVYSLALCALGFGLFWATALPVLALAGLLLIGLGVANLYPLVVSLAIRAAGEQTASASARCTLASGFAVLVLPLLLGGLADWTGIRRAYAVVPVIILLAFILLQNAVRRAEEQAAAPAGSMMNG